MGTEFEPGIYPGVPELDYHARRFGPEESLSSTEAKRILEAPAVMRWYRDNPQPPKVAFDLGHVVHALVLGTGLDVYVHDWPDLRTKAAKEDVAEARERGEVPVKRAEFDAMQTVADAVLTHPVAGPLFEHGTPEQSAYATDEQTGVWMRGRFDWVTDTSEGPTIVDLKTAQTAIPGEWARQAASYEYAVQRELYRMIWGRVFDGEEPRFLHVAVSKTQPYMVMVGEMDFDFEEVGKSKARRAIDIYAQCLADDEWPGIPPIIHRLAPPVYYVAAEEELQAEMEIH